MLDDALKTQLKAYLQRLQRPVELVATLDDSATSAELRELLQDIRAQSDKITVVENNELDVRKPSFLITNPGQVCPAKWKEGEKTIAPSLDLVGKI